MTPVEFLELSRCAANVLSYVECEEPERFMTDPVIRRLVTLILEARPEDFDEACILMQALVARSRGELH